MDEPNDPQEPQDGPQEPLQGVNEPMVQDTVPHVNAREKGATEYVVLVQVGDGDTWCPVTTVTASSAKAAVTEAADDGGDYKAVPARSWKSYRVELEQVKPKRVVREVQS